MSMLEIGFASTGIVLFLIALRAPIGIVLLLVSFGGVWAALGFQVAWGIARAIPFDFIANWSFSAVPMFLLMGYVASNGGLTDGLFAALKQLTGPMPPPVESTPRIVTSIVCEDLCLGARHLRLDACWCV